MDEPGALGTDAERVRAAIERAMSDDGVLVLMDLGSALMSTEFAIEMLEGGGRVLMSEAPLVEGTVAAAVAARGGASLEEVAAEARGALAMKASQLGVEADAATAGSEADAAAEPDAAPADAEARLEVRNAIGLHARPAALFVGAVRDYDAEVRVAKEGGGPPVRATSLTNVVALGARLGDTLVVTASGPQASEALEALRALADEGFGDGIAPDGAPPPPVPVAQPQAATVQAPGTGDVLTGVPASAGVAIGPARRLGAPPGPPPDRAADSPERERERLDEAIAAARGQIARDREAVAGRAGKAEAAIFDAHLALLDDEALLEPAHEAIAAGAAAERAWHDAAEQVAALYRGLDEPLLRERATDVLDVGRRVVAAVTGEEAAGPTEPGIVLARELTPAEAAGLDPDAGARDRHRPRLGHRARGDPRPRARPARRGRTGRRAARHRGGHRAAARRRGRDAPGRPRRGRAPRGRRAPRAPRRPPRGRARARPRARRDARRHARGGLRQPRLRRGGGDRGRARRRGRRPAAHRVPLPRPPAAARRGRAGRDPAPDRRGARRPPARRAHARRRRRQAAPGPAHAARGQPVPRRARHPPDPRAPGDPRHAAARDPARGRRAPGQGDAADGRHAGRGARDARAARGGTAAPRASTRRSSSASWSRSRPPR